MTNPSWGDFGTHDESAYPELWDGVVGAWCPSLGPTGLRLHDHSRRSNWGTLTNMDATTDWILSGGQYALNFAGTRRVSTTRALISGTQGFTMSAWVYLTGTTGYRTVCGNYGVSNFTGVQLTIWQATGGVPANAPTVYYGSTTINATTGASANQWNHVAATRTGNVVAIYLNGVQVGSGTNTASVGTSRNWTLAQDTDGTGEPMIGYIDDHAVYSRPLTPDEIRQLYLLGRGGIYQRRRRTLRRVGVEQGAAGARRRRILTGMV
ncbi:MAG TPA: hypothetical protein DC058_04165 [Planctomycetaceae bacterium]|nr:hypothetical protein [Planctomycetaceae bacterium]HBC60397.1 hypothetical protein [Planctomycetaceae bacterium]